MALHRTITSSDDTASMARSNHSAVRVRAASRPDAADDVLERLAGDRDPAVRLAVVDRPSTPPGLLARMAVVDDDPRVRARILRRTGDLPADCLPMLAFVVSRGEADALLRRDDCPDQAVATLASRHPDLLPRVVRHPNATTATLAACYDAHARTRPTCARHPNADEALIRRAAADTSAGVRAAAAANPACPADVLDDLVLSPDDAVARAAAANPNASEDARAIASLGGILALSEAA